MTFLLITILQSGGWWGTDDDKKEVDIAYKKLAEYISNNWEINA